MFWEMHDVRTYLLPADYRMKLDEIEQVARNKLIGNKIPEYLWEMSVKELTEKILDETSEENKWLMIKTRGEFCINGVMERYLPEELQEKIESARKCAVEVIDEEIEDELRKRTKNLIPKFLRWCKFNKVKTITRLSVDAFMFEIGLDYPDKSRSYIQFRAQMHYNR
jgi:hypothetical protein